MRKKCLFKKKASDTKLGSKNSDWGLREDKNIILNSNKFILWLNIFPIIMSADIVSCNI